MPNNLEKNERSSENSNVNTSQNSFPDPLVGDTQCQMHAIVLYGIYKKKLLNENLSYLNACELLTKSKIIFTNKKNNKIINEKLNIEAIPKEIADKLVSKRKKQRLFSEAKKNICEKEYALLRENLFNFIEGSLRKYLENKNFIYLDSDWIKLNIIPCYLSFHLFLNYLIKENALLIVHLTRFIRKIADIDFSEPKEIQKEYTLFYRYQDSSLALLQETTELRNEMGIVIAIHSDFIHALPGIVNSCFYEADPEKFVTRFKKLNFYKLLGVIGAAHRQIPLSAKGEGTKDCERDFSQKNILSNFDNIQDDHEDKCLKERINVEEKNNSEGIIKSFKQDLNIAYKYKIFRPECEVKHDEAVCLHAKHIYLGTANTINTAY